MSTSIPQIPFNAGLSDSLVTSVSFCFNQLWPRLLTGAGNESFYVALGKVLSSVKDIIDKTIYIYGSVLGGAPPPPPPTYGTPPPCGVGGGGGAGGGSTSSNHNSSTT